MFPNLKMRCDSEFQNDDEKEDGGRPQELEVGAEKAEKTDA